MQGELNSVLRKTVVKLRKFDGYPGILDGISKKHFIKTDKEQLIRFLDELEECGSITVEKYGDNDYTIHFKSAALSAVRDWRVRIFVSITDHIFQLLIGASGGIVALLLSKLIQ